MDHWKHNHIPFPQDPYSTIESIHFISHPIPFPDLSASFISLDTTDLSFKNDHDDWLESSDYVFDTYKNILVSAHAVPREYFASRWH